MSRSRDWLVSLATLSTVASLIHLPSVQAQSIDYRAACIQRTAEAFVVPASSIRVTQVGPVEAHTGSRTLTLQNTTTGQTALCNFSTIDNKVTNVKIVGSTPPADNRSPQQVCTTRAAEEFVVPASSIEILQVGPLVGGEFGSRTVTVRNRQNGRTAECVVSAADNSVLSFRVTSGTTPPPTVNYRQACIQRTAEAFVVPASSITVLREGPISPESGVRTLFMRNQRSGQGAECRVNTRTGAVISVNINTGPIIPPNPTVYKNGFRTGYNQGFRDGQNFRRYNSGYHPEKAIQGGSGNPDPSFDRGFRDGFFAGFNDGYYGRPSRPNPPAPPR